jgi:hypothetical protein
MKKSRVPPILACLMIGSVGIGAADAQDTATLTTRLTGFQQVPAILSNGTGTFTGTLGATSLTFTLTFSGLSSPVTAAHIHFGQRDVNGAVFVFFCGGGGKPACPAGGGTVTGTVTPADVLAVPAQGVRAGNFRDLIRILLTGNGYANVHTMTFPDGEIRGQLSIDY